MSDNKRLLIILSAVTLAFVFSYFEQIKVFSLQFFALSLLGFFVYKKSVKSKIITIVPQKNTVEISFITFSILLLIANTGNVQSIFFPLAYLHIFLLSMTARARNAIIVTFFILIFHLSFGTNNLTPREISALIILPILLLIFIFAKKEYDKAETEEILLDSKEIELKSIAENETNLENFLSNFMIPKLEIIKNLIAEISSSANQNETEKKSVTTLSNQVELLESESKKILQKLK